MSFFDSTDFMAAVCMFLAGAGFFGAVYLIVCGIRDVFRKPNKSRRPKYVHELPEWETIFQDRR